MDRAYRARHIKHAYLLIAKANHYMVGFIGPVTTEELELGKQLLIIESNKGNNKDEVVELALDLIEKEIKGRDKIGV